MKSQIVNHWLGRTGKGTTAAWAMLVIGICIGYGQTNISGPAYNLIASRVAANQSAFYVYLDQDSGLNHGFPSGFYASNTANLATIHIDAGCIDDPGDPNAVDGCAPPGSTILDRQHGTILRVTFDAQTDNNFAGLNIEEPEHWGAISAMGECEPQGNLSCNGYDLRGATSVVFDVRSPDGTSFQFGVGGCTTGYIPISQSWTTMTISLDSLSCQPKLSSVNILFAVAANSQSEKNGGTVLLDNIRFEPVPTSRSGFLGLPVANQTFGVVPLQAAASGNIPFPPDQVLRNPAPIYESALTLLALLARGGSSDISQALLIANTLDYALHHDNQGVAVPPAADGSNGAHNGYESGDIALYNDQSPSPPTEGKAGQIRLAGYSVQSCAPAGYCLEFAGATGGNNAFVIFALVAAYKQFNDPRFLNDANTIGDWIVQNLQDTTGTGYGGYYLGYQDNAPQTLTQGKSIENNADIFAAFTALAAVETQLGNTGEADTWTSRANVAGDFVMQMYDSADGRFYAGTVIKGSEANPSKGNCQQPLIQRGPTDVINTCDFLDSDTFTTLAMASAPRYRNQIDWRQPIEHVLNTFAQTATAGGQTFSGFDLVQNPSSLPNGIAWEFTGQAVVAMRFVDQLYGQNNFEASAANYLNQIQVAQSSAPFGDGQGLVASTMQGGDTLLPLDQCLNTPFQCIAERVGLAATAWAIFAERDLNVFAPSFQELPGSLSKIVVGSDGTVWGINSSGDIYWFDPQTQTWPQAPGLLTQIAVGSSGIVWGLNSAGDIYRYNPTTGIWDPVPGNLAQIAVGCDGDVWGINSSNQIYHFNPAAQTWIPIPGALTQIAVGYDGAVWGINSAQQIYRFNPGTQVFQQVPGLLTQIAVGADGDVWGINSSSQIFHFNPVTQNWDNIPGALSQIAVGSATNVWGINSQNQIFEYNPQTQSWTQIPGSFTQVAVGGNGSVWALNSEDQIFQFVQPAQPTQVLVQVPGQLAQIAVGVDGNVWGINSSNQIYTFNRSTQIWTPISGALTSIAVGFGGNVWGINSSQQIYHFDLNSQIWDPIPGLLTQIAVGANGDVWGINSAGQIYRFDPSVQNWDAIPGLLKQLSVGADGAVWGVNSADQVYRFDPQTQIWDQVPGSLSRISVGSANNVWGLDSSGGIWRYDPPTGMFDPIPGNLAQIAVAFDGTVWGGNTSNDVYRFNPQTQIWDPISGSLAQIATGGDAVVWGLDGSGNIYDFSFLGELQ